MKNPAESSSKNKKPVEKKQFLAGLFVFIVFLWLGSWLLLDLFVGGASERGQFGDKFGAINSLFSGLAFATLIYTLFLQMEELRLQRAELKLTRDEMRGQRQEFSEQNKTLKQQRFEDTFFQMLNIHVNGINAIVVNYGPSLEKKDEYRGKSFFRKMASEMLENINIDKENILPPDPGIFSMGLRYAKLDSWNEEKIKNNFNGFYKFYEHHFSAYFRHLACLIKFVHDNAPDVAQKGTYVEMIKSQLSQPELRVLFFYGVTSQAQDLKLYIEEYEIFKDLLRDDIPFFSDAKAWYLPKAYGEKGTYDSRLLLLGR